ncbi:hypothetical protein [Jannaschia sp. LMIT008]|uniref:hypothetical protein n=1 Tax=Jannaschia maritima TaxID=3032585 RepID=UPI0028111849|nr:hypothetical protein [Jannaschia sp. LMIT008]
MTCILVAGGLAAVSTFVATWIDRRKGGLVIDQRPGAAHPIARDAAMPYGHVTVFPADGGPARIEVKDAAKDPMQQVLHAILDGAFGTAAEVVKAAKGALGEDGVKSVD